VLFPGVLLRLLLPVRLSTRRLSRYIRRVA